ncbi:uncharacterized protein LOC141715095 [Apium graveolens]|uniref:uncharacterized protein LOC141715095 n=1 Tax=Apium graveolens TaxID=4045 RepID=UPI003D7B7266
MDNDTRDVVDTSSTVKKYNIPTKVIRYFPLKLRLQRVFMCKEYVKLMTWHGVGHIKDGKLRHPADAEAWKSLDARYLDFAVENQNIRLGLAADGFSPYRTMGLTHSTWPVILVNYNLPPWLIMKPENIILSTLIPGPVYPGNEIDVYMQPLVSELKELWDVGIETYDSFSDETFTLRASLLWTISDFLGLPYGCASNISHCVQMSERKIYGYKSHDVHFILQYLLQFAVIKTLDPEVAIPLIKLGSFFRGICGKVIDLEEVPKLQEEIIEILCQCKIIFPPAFFDIMVHLPIHLCKEVELGGPSYVRNGSKPEGCIAEGYLVEECLSFCSRFLSDERETKHTEGKENLGCPIGSRRNKDGKVVHLGEKLWNDAHRYILFNCDDMEAEKLIEEHPTLYDTHGKSKNYNRERTHTKEFHNWLKEEIDKKEGCSQQLLSLAKGPQREAKKHTALTSSFASAKDQNPITGDVSYYGSIEEIIEIDYWGALNVVLFKCCWMADYFFLRFHHKGPFLKTKYLGGICTKNPTAM